jgi:N-methylhydantoinase B/oxoprolinase/acetone carboxylase alpha subunit
MGPDGRQVYEEGVAIPIMQLAREGRMNEDLLRLVRANVREPLQVEGDIYACAACNDEGSRRLIEMMEEFGIAIWIGSATQSSKLRAKRRSPASARCLTAPIAMP